jgi:arylsulfatase A-like enzyme
LRVPGSASSDLSVAAPLSEAVSHRVASSGSAFLRAWGRFIVDALALLLFVQLPICGLFKLSSWRLLMGPLEILQEAALIVCLYAVGAAAVGLAVTLPLLVLVRLSRRLAVWWETFWLMAMMTIISFTLVPPGFAWWKGLTAHLPPVLGHSVPPRSFLWVLAFLAVAALIHFLRKGWVRTFERLSARLAATRRPAQVLVAVCAMVVLVTGHARWQPFGWSDPKPAAAPPPNAPNVILISIDTLAAQEMSLYGFRLPTTPNIDAFAQSASVFEHFYANSNYTIPTITSMQTGRYPTTHGVTQLRARLVPGDGERTLARELQKNGYLTASVVANDGAHPMYLRFSEGFDFQPAPQDDSPGNSATMALTLVDSRAYHWIWDWWSNPYNHVIFPLLDFGDLQAHNWFPTEPVVEKATEVARTTGKPLFLWAHFMSPHEPYLPPEPFRGRFLPDGELDAYNEQVNAARNAIGPYRPQEQAVVDRLRLRYDEYIAYTDQGVQDLLDRLRQAGVLDNAVVMLTADHGQSFEKGWHGHRGPMLHDALIRIPLVVKLPGQSVGRRIAANAEQVDLLPTILDFVGLPTPEWAEGETLRPALEQGTPTTRPKFSFDLERESRFAAPRRGNFAVIDGREKFVHHQLSGCEEFYDLAADPRESRNRVAEAAPARLTRLRGLIEAKVGVTLRPKPCG